MHRQKMLYLDRFTYQGRKGYRGSVFIMSLLLLFIVTAFALTAYTSNRLAAKNVAQLQNYLASEQAAYAALRAGREWLYNQIQRPTPLCASAGSCTFPVISETTYNATTPLQACSSYGLQVATALAATAPTNAVLNALSPTYVIVEKTTASIKNAVDYLVVGCGSQVTTDATMAVPVVTSMYTALNAVVYAMADSALYIARNASTSTRYEAERTVVTSPNWSTLGTSTFFNMLPGEMLYFRVNKTNGPTGLAPDAGSLLANIEWNDNQYVSNHLNFTNPTCASGTAASNCIQSANVKAHSYFGNEAWGVVSDLSFNTWSSRIARPIQIPRNAEYIWHSEDYGVLGGSSDFNVRWTAGVTKVANLPQPYPNTDIASVSLSSTATTVNNCFNDNLTDFCHSQLETDPNYPTVTVTLNNKEYINGILVYNRNDCCWSRTFPLAVSLFTNTADTTPVAQVLINEPTMVGYLVAGSYRNYGNGINNMLIKADFDNVLAQKITIATRCAVGGQRYLHLQNVEIFRVNMAKAAT